ncbi:MAG: DNA topoisomerase I [Coriobacteriaceae bacterium]|nr:DNA topoisomerase I [Coriobacteriaceae bacterium]
MKLVVAEKTNAAENIAKELGVGTKKDKVYNTPVCRFTREGEEWVAMGLRGHILAVDFPRELQWREDQGWFGVDEEGEVFPASLPSTLAHPPFEKVRKPFTKEGVDIKGWKVPSLPYLVWAPVVKKPAEKEIIRTLKNLAKKADEVIIATDFDREGELIGSDAVSMVRQVNEDVPVVRARYSSFTKPELEHAFARENLVAVDDDLAAAGESRQFIDLIWGAVLTRYLTMAKFGGLGNVRSAGRVQTPTLALVARREKERQAFVPEDYWVVRGTAATQKGEEFKVAHATARFKDEATATSAYQDAKAAGKARVTDVVKKTRKGTIQTPFNTTSLQTAAAAEGLTPARTMRIAESLYMSGLISYPRVDNTVYPETLDLSEVVTMLKGVPQYSNYCDELLAAHPLKATRGKQETTDHPPIYPTGVGDPDKLRPEEWKLYNLIARRFLATLSEQPVIEGTKVTLDAGGQTFTASGDVLVKPGYRAIYPYGSKKDEQLPALSVGQEVDLTSLDLEAKQTEPPARYSQGKLVQEMERLGLGTKSTRASIIERLYEVKYLKNDPIEPSQLGMAIIDALECYAAHITTPEMTSELEGDMTKVAEGKASQDAVVDHSRELLASLLEGLIEHKEDLGEAISDAVQADAKIGVCPKCGHDLLVKQSAKTRSSFIGCSAWPECEVTYPLPQGKIQTVEELCPVCGCPQIKVQPFRSKPYVVCVDPACPTNKEPDVTVGVCPTCAAAGREGLLIAHRSERTLKRFIRCTNYDECSTSYPLPQRGELKATGEVCPDCGAPIVEVTTTRGPWRICVNMDCPGKARAEEEKAAKAAARAAKAEAETQGEGDEPKKASSKKASTKKAPAKKAAAKKAPAKKASSKKKAEPGAAEEDASQE